MNETQKRELCAQLQTIDTSLVFLVLLIFSVCLSWGATAIQRRGLCGVLLGKTEEFPDVSCIRLTAGAVVIGALTFFFGLALDTWESSRDQTCAARRSAEVNLWASLFVLAAALLRQFDLIRLQGGQTAPAEESLPD